MTCHLTLFILASSDLDTEQSLLSLRNLSSRTDVLCDTQANYFLLPVAELRASFADSRYPLSELPVLPEPRTESEAFWVVVLDSSEGREVSIDSSLRG